MPAHDHQVTLSPRIYIAQFDLSGDMNAHSIGQAVELPDDVNYGDTFKQRKIGLRDMSFSMAGNVDQYDATKDQDSVLHSKMGINNVPIIVTQNSPAIGGPCEFGLAAFGQYAPQGTHGQVFKYSAAAVLASRRWLKGKVLWAPDTSIVGTASGTQVLIGAAGSTQKLYVAIAVWFVDTLTTMTVKVQSDTTGFPSATDQKTFTTVTGLTSEMPSPVNGAIADTYYRASISAFTGTEAKMIVVAAIA